MPVSWKVPFDEKGNLLPFGRAKHVEWRSNYKFHATLKYLGFKKRGRALPRLLFEDEDSHLYHMFLSELHDTLQKAIVVGDQFHGEWTFRKQGTGYSIKHV